MRTQQEILDRIKSISNRDFFGFETSDLIDFLDYEHAKEFLKEGVTEEQWKEAREKTGTPEKQIKDYIEFAWEKAKGERGLSSERSINHFTAWLWLAGDDELVAFLEDEGNYPMYGKPMLKKVTEKYAPEKMHLVPTGDLTT